MRVPRLESRKRFRLLNYILGNRLRLDLEEGSTALHTETDLKTIVNWLAMIGDVLCRARLSGCNGQQGKGRGSVRLEIAMLEALFADFRADGGHKIHITLRVWDPLKQVQSGLLTMCQGK